MNSEVFRMEEIAFEEGARLLNECAYLFVTDIREVEILEFCVVIAEGKPQAPIIEVDEKDPLGLLRLGGRPVK